MKYARRSQAFVIASSILVGSLAYAVHFGCHNSSVNQRVGVQSEAAYERLKQDHSYGSLEAAVSAARYRICSDEGKENAFYANNSAQQLSAYFTRDGVRLRVKHNPNADRLTSGAIERAKTEAPLQSDQSRLGLRFIGAGYGDAVRPAQGQPAITTADDRLTYTHHLARNHDSTSRWPSIFAKSAFRNPQSAIEEWYVNKAEGLEHGFTLREPIGNASEGERLKLELEVDGDFLADAVEENNAIAFKSKDGGARLSYGGLKVSDAQGRELAAQMSVKGAVLSFEVDDANAVYPITIDPTFTQQQKLVPGVTATDSFGSDVAISGDTAVVGASGDDIGTKVDQGSIFIFVRSGTTWSQQAKLVASDGAAGDNFGFSVTISLNTLVVGAPSDDNGSLTNQGAAYVFVRSGTTWTQQAKLTGFDSADDGFGYDVTIDGDYAAMSAKHAFFLIEGFVFVFHRVGTTWTRETEHPGEVQQRTEGDDFGESIALSGNTLVIGAPLRTEFFPQVPPPCDPPIGCTGTCYCCEKYTENGAVHILVRSGTTWSVQQTIVGAGALDSCRRTVTEERLGASVAISGNTIIIGSPLATPYGWGTVSIWIRSGTIWTSQSSISGSAALNNLGRAVAIDGNTAVYSSSGSDKVLVRSGTTWSLQQSLTSVNSSKVAIVGNTTLAASPSFTKVFVRSGTTWSEQTELTASEGATADQFGYSVAIDGDSAVVGVPFKNIGSAADQGSVFVFKRGSGLTWTQEAELTASDGATGDRFGNAVAVQGDTIAIGAEHDDNFRGSVYIFTFSGLAWSQRLKLIPADRQVLDLFGNSVALSGNTLVVGSPLNDNQATSDNGSAYVFTGSGATWTQQAKLNAIEEMDDDQFGYDVDIDGETIAVGARSVTNGTNTLQGAAYVFTRTGTTWTEQARLLASDGATDDHFGESVSVSANTLAVGSPFHNIAANANQGKVYLFYRDVSAWTQAQALTAADGAADDTFGISVALQNDALLIGANGDDFASTTAQGSAYVFVRAGATWTQAQKLFALDGATNDNYGNAVALDDLTFLIGANNDTFGSTVSQGSAYVFVASGSSMWTGANSADWSTGSNWDSTIAPNTLDDVTIPGSGVTNEAVLNANVSIHSLSIEAGRSLSINAGKTLTINGDLTLNGAIVGGGTLIFNGETFTNNNSVIGVNVQFGSGVKALNGNGAFFTNTVTVLSGSIVELADSTMNRLVINPGGTLNLGNLTLIGDGLVLTNNGTFTAGTTSTVTFSGTNAQTTAGNFTLNHSTINNPAGVTLGAEATVNRILALTNGDLRTGPFTLTMPAAATSTGTTDVVGNVKRTGFTNGNTFSFGNPFNTIRFTSGTLPTDVTMNLVKQAPAEFANAVRRTYTITPNGGSGFAATLHLHYQDTELNGNTEATLGLWRKGVAWTNLGATTRNATDNWVELVGIAQFSPWVISGPAAPTAVEFAGATATRFDDGTLIEWQTGFEVSNLGFNLYRDENGKRTLVNPQLIAGSALTAGSDTLMTAGRSYTWFDPSIADCGLRIADCKNIAYWLEDVDTNGQSRWHGPVYVAPPSGQPGDHKVRQATLLSALGKQQPSQGQSQFTPVENVASLPRAAATSGSLQKMIASDQAVKLFITKEGWYRVTREELLEAGLAKDADPRNLQLFVDGVEQPIVVVGKEPGPFEAIEFYGVGTDSPYSNQRTYWLVDGNHPGRRIPVINTKPDSNGAPSFPFTVERKDRSIYFSSLLNSDAENWFGAVVTSNGLDQPITIRSLDETAQDKAELEISLQGVTSLVANPDHQVQVRVNNQFVGYVFFDGRDHRAEHFSIPLTALKEGDNLVTLQAGAATDVSLVDRIRLTYPHRYAADDNCLKLTTAAALTSQAISGFTTNDIRVFDVTDPADVRELTGVIEPSSKTSFSIAVNALMPNRTLLAISQAEFKPASMSLDRPSSLRQPNAGADFLVIARREWMDALAPLKTLREKQGLATMLVDVEDIYDEFSFGQKTPYALREFLSYASINWKQKPRWVLFAGDASFDPRNYTGLGGTDFVPTRLTDTAFMETASDDWLADFEDDGLPELAIGRLPIRSPQDAITMVNKLLNYELASPIEELVLFADLNDGFDFESASSRLRGLLPSTLRVQEIFRSRNSDATTKANLLEALNRGQKLVNSVGHGSVSNWRGNILTTEDAYALNNSNRLPLFVMMNCLNGYFQDSLNESLAEALMRNEHGGAIAVWASSGMTFPNEQASINQQLYRTLFGKINLTLGEHVRFAKLATADADVRRSWILFGDPTTRIR